MYEPCGWTMLTTQRTSDGDRTVGRPAHQRRVPARQPAGEDPVGPGDMDGSTDEELLAAVRAGDRGAYGILYGRYRRYGDAVAAAWAEPSDRDDIVAEAFAGILRAIENGRGPVDGFSRYLASTIRSASRRSGTQRSREVPTVDVARLDGAAETPADAAGEQLAVAALMGLSARHREVLWWTEVEELSVAHVARRLSLSAGAAAALTYRARVALRQSYERILESSGTDR